MHELAKLLEIKIGHATLKHAESVRVVERAHGALKRILKLNTNEQWSNWHKYVPFATYIHNTSYYTSIGCSPTAIFHGREPVKPLDVRFNNKAIKTLDPKSDFVIELQDAMQQKCEENRFSFIESYHKYRTYYDAKANANPLKLHTYCLILNPKLSHQSDFGIKSMHVRIPLYRVEKVLTNSNDLIRKVGTNFTQCLHRIRLKPYEPAEAPVDLEDISPDNFVLDPVLGKYRLEPEMFDDEIPKLLDTLFISDVPEQIEQEESQQPVITTVNYQIAVPAVAAPRPVPPPPVTLPPVVHPPPAVAPPRQPPEPEELLDFPEPPEILLESDSDFGIEGHENQDPAEVKPMDNTGGMQEEGTEFPFADFPEPFEHHGQPPMINQQISPRIRHECTLETPISQKNLNRRVTFHPDSTKIPKPAVTQSKRKTVNIVRRRRNIHSRLQLVERTETPKNYRVIERKHEEISLSTRPFTRYKT